MKRRPALLKVETRRGDKPGKLCILGQKGLPFDVKRVFWLVVPGGERGGHAHRTNAQILFIVSGAATATCHWWEGGVRRTKVTLLRPGNALFVPPLVWLDLSFRRTAASESTCVVLASEPYSPSSYVTSRAELRRLSR